MRRFYPPEIRPDNSGFLDLASHRRLVNVRPPMTTRPAIRPPIGLSVWLWRPLAECLLAADIRGGIRCES